MVINIQTSQGACTLLDRTLRCASQVLLAREGSTKRCSSHLFKSNISTSQPWSFSALPTRCHSATSSAFHGIWLTFDHQIYTNRPRIVTNKISAYKYVARVSEDRKGWAQRHNVVHTKFPTDFFAVICCRLIKCSHLDATCGGRESVFGIVSRLPAG